jgi:hypothetical protein
MKLFYHHNYKIQSWTITNELNGKKKTEIFEKKEAK